MMSNLSDIEEASSSASLEQISEEQEEDHVQHSGKAKGKEAQHRGYGFQEQYQNSPVSTTMIPPALPSSSSSASSSSSRTITPPDHAPPTHRISSSGTVQVSSPATTGLRDSDLSLGKTKVWTPVFRESWLPSEDASLAALAAEGLHGYSQKPRQNQPYAQERVPQPDGLPLWQMGSAVDLPRQGGDERDSLLEFAARGVNQGDMRGLFRALMHGVFLALQSVVSLVVLASFAGIALWKGEDESLSGGALRNLPSLATVGALLLSLTSLLLHETYILSEVVLLYVQAGVFALTTVAVASMWMNSVQEDNAVITCIQISCGILFWGISALTFLRAVVMWKSTTPYDEEMLRHKRIAEREGRDQGQKYATFREPGSR